MTCSMAQAMVLERGGGASRSEEKGVQLRTGCARLRGCEPRTRMGTCTARPLVGVLRGGQSGPTNGGPYLPPAVAATRPREEAAVDRARGLDARAEGDEGGNEGGGGEGSDLSGRPYLWAYPRPRVPAMSARILSLRCLLPSSRRHQLGRSPHACQPSWCLQLRLRPSPRGALASQSCPIPHDVVTPSPLRLHRTASAFPSNFALRSGARCSHPLLPRPPKRADPSPSHPATWATTSSATSAATPNAPSPPSAPRARYAL